MPFRIVLRNEKKILIQEDMMVLSTLPFKADETTASGEYFFNMSVRH